MNIKTNINFTPDSDFISISVLEASTLTECEISYYAECALRMSSFKSWKLSPEIMWNKNTAYLHATSN